MQYKKILLDIDGTILDKQEKLSDSLAKALEKDGVVDLLQKFYIL